MLSRLPSLMMVLAAKCASMLNLADSGTDFTANAATQYYGSSDSEDLIIFIHGLCGNAKTTWTNPSTGFNFPQELALDLASQDHGAYVVVFGYVSHLQGGPSILSIADHLEFEIGEILKKHSYRTLRIVAHSMGGIVAREYVLRRQPRAHPQLKVTNLVLLASPTNGSELAKLGRWFPRHRQIEELRHIDKDNTYLEALNKDWNREFKGGGHPRHVLLYAGYEEVRMPILGRIVKLSSAIPYADESIGFQETHVTIAKPKDRNVVYLWVKAKLEESLENTARQLLAGMVNQGLLAATDIPQRLPQTVELLEQLQTLAGTELEKVLAHVKTGQFQAALDLLGDSESNENRLIADIARRRFTQGEIYELQFQMESAASYYAQAVQFAPGNPLYRNRLGWLFFSRGDTSAAIPQFEEAARLSHESGDLISEGGALNGLGNAYLNQGQYAKALQFLRDALVCREKSSDKRGEANELGNLGTVYMVMRDYPKSIEFSKQALAIHREIGDVHGEANDVGNLGSAYKSIGDYSEAIKLHEDALIIHKKIGDVRGEGNDLGNLGNVYIRLGQYHKAIHLLEGALTIHRKLMNKRGEAIQLGGLGTAYLKLDKFPDAIQHYEWALEIYRTIKDPQSEATDLVNLATAYLHQEKYDKGIELLKEALAVRQKIGDERGEGIILANLGTAYLNLEQYQKAIELLEQALVIQRGIGDLQGEAYDLGCLGSAYASLGERDKGIELLKKSQVLFEERLRITFPMKSRLEELKNMQ